MDKKTTRNGIILCFIFLFSLNIYLYINDFSLIFNDNIIAKQLIEMSGTENIFHKMISMVVGFSILFIGLFLWNKNQDE